MTEKDEFGSFSSPFKKNYDNKPTYGSFSFVEHHIYLLKSDFFSHILLVAGLGEAPARPRPRAG